MASAGARLARSDFRQSPSPSPDTGLATRRSFPRPFVDLRLVDAVLVGVGLTIDLHVAQLLFRVRAGHLQAWNAIDDVYRQAEPVDLVPNGQIEWGVDVAPL